MAFGKLYGANANPRTIPILVAAKANNIELEFIETAPRSTDEEFRKVNKLGKIPTFVGSDGFVLSETIAISIYNLIQAFSGWLYPHYGILPYNKRTIDEGVQKSYDLAKLFEERLLHNTFLVGERLTLADIFAASMLSMGFGFIFDKKWRSDNPCTTRWYTLINNHPIYSAVAGEMTLIDEVQKFQPPKKETVPKKEVTPKKVASKKQAVSKSQEEDDEAEPVEAKPKHPLESLPKPSLPLDEWKRQYSNNETPDALKWFWENFNAEEYSLWQIDYKYNDELTQIFMSSNLIGGFFARLEASRKYIFGSASVYGVKDDSIIQGAFIVCGQESGPAFEVAPDWESYQFTKLDSSKEEDRKFVNDQWTWEKPITVNGKEYPWVAGKVFK